MFIQSVFNFIMFNPFRCGTKIYYTYVLIKDFRKQSAWTGNRFKTTTCYAHVTQSCLIFSYEGLCLCLFVNT